MRILGVTFHNLASLQGRHSIRFDEGPLAQMGLFAITGPTGAGKSTILDAICLALYSRTPRLTNQGGVEVGRPDEERLKDHDARSLVSRGCAEGWAEVEYRGQDGEIYVSKWHAQRAHQRVSGRFQNAKMSLVRKHDGLAVAGKLSEVVARNEGYLGLNFVQFTRSVMLAQGEFAAFLKAKTDDRADLLERMTGTDLYGTLSKLAHEEAKAKRDALALLQAQANANPPLTQEARTELAERLRRLEADRTRLDATVKQLEQAQAWHRQLSELAAKIQAASEQAARASAAVAENAACWERLRQVEDAERHRAKLEAVQSRSEDLAKHQVQLQEAEQSLEAAVSLRKQSEALANETRQRLESAEAARRARQPEINEARQQDALIESLTSQATEAQRLLVEAQQAHAQALADLRSLVAQQEAAQEALNELTTELVSLGDLNQVVEGWAWLKGQLTQLAKVDAEVIENQVQSQRMEAELATLAAQQSEALAAIERHEAAVRAAESELASAETALANLDPSLVRRQREHQEERLVTLKSLVELVADCINTRHTRDAYLTQHQDMTARVASLEAHAKEQEAQAESLAVRMEQTQRLRNQIFASLSLEDRRSDLVDGEPCPLCGSTTHPIVGKAPAASALDPLDHELAQLSVELNEVREATTIAFNDARHASDKATEAQDAAAALTSKLEALKRQWGAARDNVDDLAASDASPDISDLERIHGSVQATEVEVARLKTEQQRVEALQQVKIQAMETLADTRVGVEDARRRHETLKAETALVEQRRSAAQQQHVRGLQAIADLTASAAKLLGEPETWRDLHVSDPEGFLDAWQARVERFLTLKTDHKAKQTELADLAPKLARAEAVASSARDLAATQAAEVKRILADLTRKRENRSRLLDGRPVDAFEQELEHACNTAKQADEDARGKVLETTQSHIQRSTARDDLRGMVGEDQQALAQAEIELNASLSELDLSLEELHSRLSHSRQWFIEERSRLDALKDAETAARTELQLHQRSHADLSGQALTTLDAQTVARELAEASVRRVELQAEAEQARTELAVDDQRREQLQTLNDGVREAEQVALTWDRLDEIIGSATGAKFKRFAQSLTLDTLLVHANRHLKDLTPRYRLQRVADADLDLQIIDTHLLDEVRSVHTLSGGETFLASLALSLGMASMASRHARIDTLFIDEGFGTLDEETLSVALEALEALQSSGKQVGMISHVPGLARRIGAGIQVTSQGAGRSRLEVFSQ